MAMVLKYIVGLVLVVGLIAICVKCISSIVAKLREFARNRKKSPEEGKAVKVDKTDTEETGKEVNNE